MESKLSSTVPTPLTLDESPRLQRLVTSSQIRIALRAAPHNLGAGVSAIVFIVAGTSYSRTAGDFSPSAIAFAWSAVMLVCMLVGIYIALRYARDDREDEEVHRGGEWYLVNAFIAAVGWGSTSWLLLPGSAPEQEGFLLALMAMVVAAGGGAQAMYRPLVRTFTVTLSVVFVAGLLRFGETYYAIVGLAFIVYTGAILMYANDQEAAIATTIRLSATNEALFVKSTEERKAALNAKLEADVARAQAEAADRAKTTFIAAASHDLRQPLHALVQYVSHLKKEDTHLGRIETVAKIDESVAAIEGLLNAVLDFSKISMGVVKPVLEPLDVKKVLQRLETQIRPIANAKDLCLVFESCEGAFFSDEILLDRVLSNVTLNAVKYTDAGVVKVRAISRAGVIRVLISDSGIGIENSQKEKIFDEFYQIANQARDRNKGLGLGLAIVRDLAALLQLSIRLKSAPGVGSTFIVDVPIAQKSRAKEVPAPDDGAVDYVRGAFVVLIDDDRLARDGARMTLMDFGCRVLCASSGKDAIDRLSGAEFPPQLLISDYRLEDDSTGLDAISLVRNSQSRLFGDHYRLPAIVISGDTSPEELQRVASAGYRMLHKPVRSSVLYDALNEELAALAHGEESPGSPLPTRSFEATEGLNS